MRSGSLPLSSLVHLPLPECPTATCASFSARRDLAVFVSPPARSARSTATDGDCRPGRRSPPTRSPGPPRGARPRADSQQCRHTSARPDAADPSTWSCRSSPGSTRGRCTARLDGQRMLPRPWDTFPYQGGCTGGSRLWSPGLRLAFQKGHLAAKTWWAQPGSNQRPLACKAKWIKDRIQPSGSAHTAGLRKPCREMS
jgi:hypothetical protein